MTAQLVPAEWAGARLMVMDDEEPVRRSLAWLLAESGYRDVQCFATPASAIAAYRHLQPDLVLLDLHVPGADGAEVLHHIAGHPVALRAPVLVMTGSGRAQDVHRSLALGAADFLHKPVDTAELLLRVRHQLRAQRLQRDLARHNDDLEQRVADRAGELAILLRVLDGIPVAAAVLNGDLGVRYANARGRRLAGEDLLAVLAPDPAARRRLVAFLRGVPIGGSSRLTVRVPGVRPAAPPGPVGAGGVRLQVEAQRVEGDLLAILVHDVELQQRTRESLERALRREQEANEELRAVEELRSGFVTAVSHELRTPLTVVLGMAEALHRHEGELDPDRRRGLQARLLHSARRLAALLEDLLDLSRDPAGGEAIAREPHDLAVLVGDAREEIDASDHPIALDLVAVEVLVEPTRIRRAIVNLLRNAVVHTPPGTPVEVGIRLRDDVVRLVIADAGPGIPDGRKERIFARFEQGPEVPRHQPGTGIGLSLVREFVRLHGGSTWVQDTPGGGATFVLELPRPRSGQAATGR